MCQVAIHFAEWVVAYHLRAITDWALCCNVTGIRTCWRWTFSGVRFAARTDKLAAGLPGRTEGTPPDQVPSCFCTRCALRTQLIVPCTLSQCTDLQWSGPWSYTKKMYVLWDPNQWRTQEFCSGGGGSTNSVEDRGRRERVSGGRQSPSQGFWRQM